MSSSTAAFVTPPPDPELLRRLLAEQAPALASAELAQLPGGRDNAAIRVGHDLVARLPLHSRAAPLMTHEQRWMPEIAPSLPVLTSAPVISGQPGGGYPHPWSVARWIEGGTADRTPYDPSDAAPVLVRLLQALHQPAPADAPMNPLRSVPLAERLPRFREHLAELRHPDADRLVAMLTERAALPEPTGPLTWTHGDLHHRNVIVDGRSIVGVIDWGDLHAGDRVTDYAAVWMLLSTEEHHGVRAALGADDVTWERARGWALVFGVLLMVIGAADGDRDFFAAGETTLARAMSSGRL